MPRVELGREAASAGLPVQRLLGRRRSPAATSRRLTLRRRRAAPAFAAQQGQLVRVDDLQLGCANWLTPAFRPYPAEHLYGIEATHNPEVAGSNPAPATQKGPGNGAFSCLGSCAGAKTFAQLCPRGRRWRGNPANSPVSLSYTNSTVGAAAS